MPERLKGKKCPMNMLISLILMCAISDVKHANSALDIAFWPDPYMTETNEMMLILLEFKPNDIDCRSYCNEIQLTHSNTNIEKFPTYNRSILKIDVQPCPQETNSIRVECGEKTFKFQTYRIHGYVQNGFMKKNLGIPHCPEGTGVLELTVPMVSPQFSPLSTNIFYCEDIGFTKSVSANYHENETETHLKDGKECVAIQTVNMMQNCSKSQVNERLKERQNKEHWCKINKARTLDKGIMELTIPYRKGGLVCIKGTIKGKKHQECKSVISKNVVMKVESKIKQVEITCDDQVSVFYSKEEKMDYCPMPYKGSRFSMFICQKSYRPIYFWLTLMWLCLGFPFCYTMNRLTVWLRCRWHMMKLIKKCRCPNCAEMIYSEVDAKNHDRCDENVCPYCEYVCLGNNDLRRHVKFCPKKDEVIEKNDQIIEWERSGFNQIYGGSNKNIILRIRVGWTIVFIFVFLMCFVPTIAQRSRYEHRNFGYDQINARNPITPNIPRQPYDPYVPKDDPKVESEDDKLEEASRSIIINLQTFFLNHSILLEDAIMSNMDSQFNDLKLYLQEIERQGISHWSEMRSFLYEINPGNSSFENLNLNLYLPPTHHRQEFALVKIHKDDVRKFSEFGNIVQSIMSSGEEIGMIGRPQHGSTSLGSDAILQIGGHSQSAIGGSGSNKKMAIGGSTNTDVNVPSDLLDYQPRKEEITIGERLRGINIYENNRKGRRLHSIETSHLSQLEIDQLNIDLNKQVMADQIKLEAHQKRKRDNPRPDFHNFRGKQVNIKGQQHTINEIQIHSKESIISKTANQKTKNVHANWYDFHTGTTVCKQNCLHEPGTCNCISNELPKSGKLNMPWATFDINDIHFVVNPNKFSTVMATIESESKNEIITKFATEVKMDLYENSFITMELQHEKSATNPTLTVIIPRISQIYSTKFLYYTCERDLYTEVKGVCTGSCGDYCAGFVCLGSRIWKWPNCRAPSCNPLWCWAWNDGCCCCGSNVYCEANKARASVWEVQYLRTEYLLCVIMNDRLQNCKLVDGTTKIDFGNFQIGATRNIDPTNKLSKHIMVVHRPILSPFSYTMSFEQSSEIYLDPPVCKGLASCNHGFIGDVQTMKFECLSKLGTYCKSTTGDLGADECSEKVHVVHSDTVMNMQCHTGKHHTCSHENVVKAMNFDSHLSDTEKILDRFIINKLKVNFEKNELLIYPTAKDSSGFIILNIEGSDIAMPKKDLKPNIINIQTSRCTGCYSCKTGFECQTNIEVKTELDTSVRLRATESGIDLNHSPVTLKNGVNKLTIKGIAYENAEKARICVMFSGDCIYESKLTLKLHEPTGEFVPIFGNDLARGGDGESDCTGIKWFSCFGNSVSGFFGMIIGNWKTTILLIIGAIFLGVLIMFSPQIIIVVKALKNVCCKKENKLFIQGRNVGEVYKELSTKIKKEMKNNVKNEEKMTQLLLQRDDYQDLV